MMTHLYQGIKAFMNKIRIVNQTAHTFALFASSRTTGPPLCSKVSRTNVNGLAPSRKFNNFWKRRVLCVLLCCNGDGAILNYWIIDSLKGRSGKILRRRCFSFGAEPSRAGGIRNGAANSFSTTNIATSKHHNITTALLWYCWKVSSGNCKEPNYHLHRKPSSCDEARPLYPVRH